jgi:DMSO/TMAO reductase YedYZ heme-binding membrane subunit
MQSTHFGFKRVITHLFLGGIPIMLSVLLVLYFPRGKPIEFLIIAWGYLSLLLICIALLIGPLNLLRMRRNPVNLDLRRDVGIWAAITGCVHILLFKTIRPVTVTLLSFTGGLSRFPQSNTARSALSVFWDRCVGLIKPGFADVAAKE